MIVTLSIFLLLMQSVTPEAIQHSQAGAAAQRQGNLDVAIEEFRKVIELQPDSPSGYANLGETYFLKGNYDSAIPELEHALRLSSTLVGAQQTLGVALLIQGDAAGALPHLEKAHTPELLGLAYLETGRLANAILALQQALGQRPNDPDLLYYFGRATALASRRAFDQLEQIKPGSARARHAAGERNGETGRSPEAEPASALGELIEAVGQHPNNPDLLDRLGRATALASGRAFDQIIKTNAGSARAHQVAAERYVEAGRIAEAKKEYEESLRLRPYSAGVHLALGRTLAAEGDWPAATAEFRAESRLRPLSAEAFYHLGSALFEQGQAGEALAKLERADQLGPNTPEILLALGQAASLTGDRARAEKFLTKLLESDKQSDLAAQAHLALATIYRQAGKTPDADREMAAYEKLKGAGKQ